jgi:hypothetical protein
MKLRGESSSGEATKLSHMGCDRNLMAPRTRCVRAAVTWRSAVDSVRRTARCHFSRGHCPTRWVMSFRSMIAVKGSIRISSDTPSRNSPHACARVRAWHLTGLRCELRRGRTAVSMLDSATSQTPASTRFTDTMCDCDWRPVRACRSQNPLDYGPYGRA